MNAEAYVIANAAQARLMVRSDPDGPLRPVVTLEHPESRLTGHELATDRMGQGLADQRGGAGTVYEPKTDTRRKEHARFAREVAQHLKSGLRAREFERFVLFASSPFLGELKAVLDDELRRAMRAAVDVDLTSYEHRDLEQRVADALKTSGAG